MKKVIYNYTTVFELNENKGFTVTVPALPGLVTPRARPCLAQD